MLARRLRELDGKVPYVLVAGNHDYTPHGDVVSGRSGMNKYFLARPVPQLADVRRRDERRTTSPTAITCSVPAGPTGSSLLWNGPRATRRSQWANEVLAKYPRRKAILVTHAYLYDDSTRYDWAKKGKSQEWNPHDYAPKDAANDGEELWQKLVRKHDFALTLNGHVCHSGLGFLSSKNDRGQMTHQMLVDYQQRPLGGEGYLRILEFLPDGKTVQVKSYSPLYDKYLRDAGNQFTFQLDP